MVNIFIYDIDHGRWEKNGAVPNRSVKYLLQEIIHTMYPPVQESSLYDCKVFGVETEGVEFVTCRLDQYWIVSGKPRSIHLGIRNSSLLFSPLRQISL